jgi:hypothetical protein
MRHIKSARFALARAPRLAAHALLHTELHHFVGNLQVCAAFESLFPTYYLNLLQTNSDVKSRESSRVVGISGGRGAHAAVSRRPPIPLFTIVARTHMFTYNANVLGSIVQGPFSVAPCQR